MKNVLVLASGLIISAAVFFNTGCSNSHPGEIRICGSTTIESYMKAAAAEFGRGHHLSVSIDPVGSVSGIDSLIAGSCDIAMSSMEMPPEQTDIARGKGIAVKPFLLGYDVIVPIVNPKNSVTDITSRQLTDMFTGVITRWSELGGNDAGIEIVERTAASGTFAVWHRDIAAGPASVPESTKLASNSAVLAYVARHENAIGYISHAYLNPEVKALSLDGISSDADELLLSEYTLKRPLFLYVREDRFDSRVKNFIIFMIINDRGKELLRGKGFFYNYMGEKSPPFLRD
ncbi:PstS family phosphate ABC transporter substrate-binding protein [bacterium]|nr:PstS family phosphate ABC transporter substrate-binding protein [bacterium]